MATMFRKSKRRVVGSDNDIGLNNGTTIVSIHDHDDEKIHTGMRSKNRSKVRLFVFCFGVGCFFFYSYSVAHLSTNYDNNHGGGHRSKPTKRRGGRGGQYTSSSSSSALENLKLAYFQWENDAGGSYSKSENRERTKTNLQDGLSWYPRHVRIMQEDSYDKVEEPSPAEIAAAAKNHRAAQMQPNSSDKNNEEEEEQEEEEEITKLDDVSSADKALILKWVQKQPEEIREQSILKAIKKLRDRRKHLNERRKRHSALKAQRDKETRQHPKGKTSRDYKLPESMYRDDCTPQHEWQTQFHPICNTFHELDVTMFGGDSGDSQQQKHNYGRESDNFNYVASGGYRDVWKFQDHRTSSKATTTTTASDWVVLKTLIIKREFDLSNYDRHRRDSIATDKLTFSSYISSIYGACSNSGLYEFADGGSLEDMIYEYDTKLNTTQRLILAYHTAAAVRDTHYTDGTDINSLATIAHTDIKSKQFVYLPQQGILKLTDYNRCRLLSYDNSKDDVCTFLVKANKGKYRSPEEYNYLPETEKVDVYSLGNILYTLVTDRDQYDNKEKKEAMRLVRKGILPEVEEKYLESKDPAIRAMVKAMYMCWEYDYKKRSSSYQVAKFLDIQLQKLRIPSNPRLYIKEGVNFWE